MERREYLTLGKQWRKSGIGFVEKFVEAVIMENLQELEDGWIQSLHYILCNGIDLRAWTKFNESRQDR